MAKFSVYGDAYDRFDTDRFQSSISEETIAQFNELYIAGDEGDLDDAMEDLDYNEYSIIQAMVEQSGMDGVNAFQQLLDGESVGVFVEELVFGVGANADAAKLAFLQVSDDMRG